MLDSVAEKAEVARERLLFWLHFLRNRVTLAGSETGSTGGGANCDEVVVELLLYARTLSAPPARRHSRRLQPGLRRNWLILEFAARLILQVSHVISLYVLLANRLLLTYNMLCQCHVQTYFSAMRSITVA